MLLSGCKVKNNKKTLAIVLSCNSFHFLGERLWDESIPYRHACTADCDFPATDRDTHADRHADTADSLAAS